MRIWILAALAYLYLAWTFFRLCRRDHSSWWFTSALTVCGPLLMPIGLLMQLGKLRHFSFRGFVARQRASLGLTALNPEPLPVRWPSDAVDQCHPDDGGFDQ